MNDGTNSPPQVSEDAVLHPASHTPIKPVAGTGKRVAIATSLVAVALVLLFAFGLWSRHRSEKALDTETEGQAQAPEAVEVATVHRAAPKTFLTLPGDARAFNETTLYARTNGYINKWVVDIGDRVKQGQTLAIIDTPELDEQLNAAKAKVAQARSEAKLANAAAKFAKLTYERWESAAPEGVVSEQERDQKKSELDTADAKVDAANSEVDVDEAEVHRLQTLISFKNVTAPFDGTITERHIDIGDLVTAGSTSSTTPLFTIARSDQLRVFVDVSQGAIPQIKPHMSAVVTADEFPDLTFKGQVDRAADALDRTSRTMRVEVLVANPNFALKPGDYVQVSFETDRSNPPLEVPAGALTMKPQGPEVAVVASDSTIKFHPIKIVQDNGETIEVSSGVADGDRVALNIGDDVADGDHIAIHEEPTASPVAPAAKLTVKSDPKNQADDHRTPAPSAS